MECNDHLRQSIAQRLQGFERHEAAGAGMRKAAVAVCVTEVGPGAGLPGINDIQGWSNQAALMLTRRSQKLRNHPANGRSPADARTAGKR